jgi:hypothetical protein
MSTKNLSKSVIEGGRYRRNKWERRNSHSENRAHEKNYLADIKHDSENWYDYDIEPTANVYKEFRDKLGPMNRWLESQCGRLWNDVRSEVAKKFDTRTTAGRHIVFDHLLSSVEEQENLDYRGRSYKPEDWTVSYYRYAFYVDDAGILRQKTKIPRPNQKFVKYNTNEIANWLSGRIVGKVGNKLFWFIPADKNKKHGGVSHSWKTEWNIANWYGYWSGLRFLCLREYPVYKKDPLTKLNIFNDKGKPILVGTEKSWVPQNPISFRQGKKLSNKEECYFNNLPKFYQDKILELSPTNENPVKPGYNNRLY